MWVEWIVGCASDGLAPRIEASGGGAGYWPPNSPTAVAGAAASGFDGIELDIALTRDRIPVLVDGARLLPSRCVHADGSPLAEPVRVRHRTLAEIKDRFLCGGIPDPAYPNALVVDEPVLTLDEAVDLLHDAPAATVVHLDLHLDDGTKPEVFARQVLDRWFAEDLPQAMYVTGRDPDLLRAVDAHGRLLGFDVPTDLVVFDDLDPWSIEAERWANGLDYVTRALEADADGLAIPGELADRTLIDAARDEGLTIGVWTVDAPRALAEWSRPGKVDAVLTGYPGDRP